MARTGGTSPEIVPNLSGLPTGTKPMTRRRLYVVDLDTEREIKSVDVEGWAGTKITALERQLWAQCGEDLVVRDSQLDRDDHRP